ncbi:MAG: OsmC family protein [Armatimonadota bacterium]|nr:OsmC family protein [Armatimonadota bacterium]MDR7402185.1 OsmC family protein [Armatimonadota bacterium]MDR7404635.1 OsmC family protein [Armatimonadota bacterium]MDR7436942.1 OsmC family protein [Armatimonadota bacterium]MDR7472284.1 OsmC family protein [Armatimonadota bacterium]
MAEVRVEWRAPMVFVGGPAGAAPVLMDASPEAGGTGVAPSPMETVLAALAGCSGIDVVSILQKMRAPLAGLRIDVAGERAPEPPRVFTAIRMRYTAWGPGLDPEAVRRAVALSLDRYCSVAAMLRATAAITHEVVVAPGDAVDRPPVAS